MSKNKKQKEKEKEQGSKNQLLVLDSLDAISLPKYLVDGNYLYT